MDVACSMQVEATLVANEFIDRYMAEASGEYVKVYLYVLRHQKEQPGLEQIADALNHTEADVKRALSYWERIGALRIQDAKQEEVVALAEKKEEKASRARYDAGQMSRLQGDGDFSQLLYIVQRYLSKVFTQREVEVFAYLYDGLHMPVELLEYLVEYCVQNGHTSLRYIETVALNWHEREINTVEMAKAHIGSFTKDTFSVMRAFGLTDRKPGDGEKELIQKWFGTYGFTREIVLEACNRTMEATHNPSFRYADKILSEWSKAGVKSLRDISEMDEKRRSQSSKNVRPMKKTTNQFHNFEQRETNYDSLVMNQVKDWIGEN